MIDKGFRLTMVALVLGWLLFFAALTEQAKQDNENPQDSRVGFLSGLYILIGTCAYRSAKRRKLGIKPTNSLRRGIEILGVILAIGHPFLALTPQVLSRDPFPLVIGLWILVAYIVINLPKEKVELLNK